jgi:hypothetical protein
VHPLLERAEHDIDRIRLEAQHIPMQPRDEPAERRRLLKRGSNRSLTSEAYFEKSVRTCRKSSRCWAAWTARPNCSPRTVDPMVRPMSSLPVTRRIRLQSRASTSIEVRACTSRTTSGVNATAVRISCRSVSVTGMPSMMAAMTEFETVTRVRATTTNPASVQAGGLPRSRFPECTPPPMRWRYFGSFLAACSALSSARAPASMLSIT